MKRIISNKIIRFVIIFIQMFCNFDFYVIQRGLHHRGIEGPFKRRTSRKLSSIQLDNYVFILSFNTYPCLLFNSFSGVNPMRRTIFG